MAFNAIAGFDPQLHLALLIGIALRDKHHTFSAVFENRGLRY